MTRILTFGTFDMVHEGHRDFFSQARSLAKDAYLIVSVARDSAVHRIKGVYAKHDEKSRRALVEEKASVDEAILGSETDYIRHIVDIRPDIIALVYDQEGEYVENLKERLADADFYPRIVRLNAFEPEKYKTSRLRIESL